MQELILNGFARHWCRENILVNTNETRQIWGIWKLRPVYSPETPNLGQDRWCFVPYDHEIWWMTLENNRASLPCCFKLWARFLSHRWILNWNYSPETPNFSQIRRFLEPCDLEIWRMTFKNNRAPLQCYFKLCASFGAIGEFKMELQSGNDQSGSNSTIFRALWPCNLTYDLEKQ